MKTMKTIVTGIAAVAVVIASGCSATNDSGMSSEEPEPDQSRPDEERLIEESDIYKLDGDRLFVQNPTSGLNVVDVTDPADPVLVDRLETLTGQGGEIYVRDDRAYVLFERTSATCTVPTEVEEPFGYVPETTEAVAVVTARTEPKEGSRICLPGTLVASRIVGDILYMVSSYDNSYEGWYTWIVSVDVTDPRAIALADQMVLSGTSHEIHATTEAIFIAQETGGQTAVRYVDITDPAGTLIERGSVTVSGTPQGRFHMDHHDGTFRIVTWSGLWSGSNLHVIDVGNPDHLRLVGSLSGLAPNEELWATRFVGDRAYVVTYLRDVPMPSDPLWVIDLSDPASPTVLGELHIPGWSTYLFPRGDRLLATGRGERGNFVAVSLFDISDPTDPTELAKLEFGESEATSEANTDHRGVRVIEDEAFGSTPLMLVPYTDNEWTYDGCTPEHHLQLIDVLDDDLEMRGTLDGGDMGRVLRTQPLTDIVYAISERQLTVVDVEDRDDPASTGALALGTSASPDQCTFNDFIIDPLDDDAVMSFFPFGCSMSPTPTTGAGPLVLALAALAILLARRLRRQ